MDNRINTLIIRYESLIGERPMRRASIKKIENDLGVKFSQDFYLINEKCCYGNFTYELFNPLTTDDYSVIGATKVARSDYNIPSNIIILSEAYDALILMETSLQGENEKVYIISVEDFERFSEKQPLLYQHRIFPTFADFFEYLLDEEEKLREQSS